MHIPFRKTSKKDCLKEVEADVRLGQKPPLSEVMPACLWTDKPSNAACLWTFHYITIHLLVDITLHYNTHACEHYITIHLLVNNREPLSKLNALYSSPRLHPASRIACGQIFPQMHMSLQKHYTPQMQLHSAAKYSA